MERVKGTEATFGLAGRAKGYSEPLMVRPEEAARRLGISRTKLFELLASGEIKSKRSGRMQLIPVSALLAWSESDSAA